MPNLNPVEGARALLRHGSLSNVTFHTPEHLDRRIRRDPRHVHYRSHLMDSRLTETGPTIRSNGMVTASSPTYTENGDTGALRACGMTAKTARMSSASRFGNAATRSPSVIAMDRGWCTAET
ncbi:hypothetical protein GCM10027160_07160 [Streptomyces calidiresistens]